MTSAQTFALAYGLLGFLVIWAVLLIPQILGQQARFGRVLPRRLARTALVTLYACLTVALVLLPLPGPGGGRLGQHIQLVPFQWTADVARESVGNPLTTLAFQQLSMNVLLFVPLGIFARVLWRRGFTGATLLGLAGSAAIEVCQLTANFGTAPYQYRIFDVDDLMANTVGASLGWVLAALFLVLRAQARRADALSGATTQPLTTPARPARPTVPAYAGQPAGHYAGPRAQPWSRRR
ncbi:VanZ family protein [Amycolatopsis cihanbeyliensis]|uniref:Glycopeptide antibiotics resistance protein n=1 Tax=Amycolatopsis cihanbeyliensis TaxID=1128664 RepID=A0A542DKR8_AMYCI|nr:VanZ family protein [Amycolatopsis cihanbeyliensis]TQJ03701.1 glycopeptide antibiotics resistance protein [Amycolatopsis cihanbeyliensis]